MSDATTDIRLQVMWNRLISVVEEQAMTLLRTAFSTSVREAGDLSAGVFDDKGRMLAQAVTGTPGHVNTMAEAVGHFVDAIPREQIFPGDTVVRTRAIGNGQVPAVAAGAFRLLASMNTHNVRGKAETTAQPE